MSNSGSGSFDALEFFCKGKTPQAQPYVPPKESEPPVTIDAQEVVDEPPSQKDDSIDLEGEEWDEPQPTESTTPPTPNTTPSVQLVEAPESTQTRPAFAVLASNSPSRSGLKRFIPSIQWLPDVLVSSGRISAADMSVAAAYHRQYGGRSCFSSTLIKLELLGSKEVLNLLHERYGLPHAKLSKQKLGYDIFQICPISTCKKLQMLAFYSGERSAADKAVCVVVSAPSDEALREAKAIRLRTRRPLEIQIANESAINAVIEELEFTHQNDGDPTQKEIRQIFVDAIDSGSSDVHFEPYDELLAIRFRIDGGLRLIRIYPKARKDEVMRAAMLFAKMNIGTENVPQDTEVELPLRAKVYKLRMSTIPSTTGQSIVGRLLDKEAGMVDFVELGMEPDHEKMLSEILAKPEGAIINVGPTGSGKSTSMLAILSKVDASEEKILTIENPPEYRIARAQQVKYHEKNIPFAAAIRSFMRQDPDHIMVGEIRDLETCVAAIQAALTGHKVYSTLHGNHALAGMQRFLDWDVDLSSVAEGVAVLIAQRLLRRLCQHCRVPDEHSERHIKCYNIKLQGITTLYKANPDGCPHCSRGFKGRIGAFELIPIKGDPVMAEAVVSGGADVIQRCVATAREQGYRFLREDAFLKVGRGLTTVYEVLANVSGASIDVDTAS